MDIYVDGLFCIGSEHKVCQDFEFHGNVGDVTCAIVADGCSSSPNTDIGSRMVGLSLYKALTESFQVKLENKILEETIYHKFICNLTGLVQYLPISIESYDSTVLGIAYNKKFNEWCVIAFGDGIIGYLSRDDKNNIIDGKSIIEYKANAPYYPSYLLDPKRLAKFAEIDNEILFHNESSYADQQSTVSINSLACPVVFDVIESDRNIKTVIISTDGMGSFINETDQSNVLDITNVMDEMIKFKNTRGEFIQRRVNKVLRLKKKEGYNHFDDFSIAAIHIED